MEAAGYPDSSGGDTALLDLASLYEQQFYELRKWTIGSSDCGRDAVESAGAMLTEQLVALQARQGKVVEVLMEAVEANGVINQNHSRGNFMSAQASFHIERTITSYVGLSAMVSGLLCLVHCKAIIWLGLI